MTQMSPGRVRAASIEDIGQLLTLWALLFDDDHDDHDDGQSWRGHARQWFGEVVSDREAACFPMIEVDGVLVATAIGTLERGVPNPFCPRGRTVRLANVVTAPDHRGNGYGTLLVESVVDWARSIDADRVDLSATPDGQRIYDRTGFVLTSAPRMKFML